MTQIKEVEIIRRYKRNPIWNSIPTIQIKPFKNKKLMNIIDKI
jgi:hypothetical protein